MEAPGNPDILKLFPLVSRLDPFDLTRKSLATSDIMTLLHVSRPNIWEIWKKNLLFNSRYYAGVLTGADIQNIRPAVLNALAGILTHWDGTCREARFKTVPCLLV